MSKSKKSENNTEVPKVWVPSLVDIDLIDEDPGNTNKQDRETFKALQENIAEHGIDENCILVPKGTRFLCVHGNHRLRAARSLGVKQIPGVIRPDWDEVTASVQSVRRNTSRGELDKKAFTELVNELHKEHDLDFAEIQEGMGFHDADVFASMYQSEQREQERVERVENEDLPKIRAMDDIVALVSHLIEEHGETLLQSFLLIPVGGRTHLYISSTNALKQVLTKIVGRCKETGLDINTCITGLLHIGIQNTNFIKDNKVKEFDQLEKDLTIDPEDTDLDI
jgi:hypothetical protein